jgi:hypothetical protein
LVTFKVMKKIEVNYLHLKSTPDSRATPRNLA